MDTLRGNNPVNWNNKKEIRIQLIDLINSNNIIEEELDNGKKKIEKKFVIRAFGVTEEGYSVSLNINEFTPHFYIKIDYNFGQFDVKSMISSIKSKMNYYSKDDLISYDVVLRKDVWGFNNNKNFKFLRILFKNTNAMNDVVKLLKKNKIKVGTRPFKSYKDSIYEANILPLLRFLHINKIEPSNWIKLRPLTYTVNIEKTSRCQIDIEVHWKKVISMTCQKMTPFIKVSYDIECDSQHGDFPLAKKNYKKLASEMFDNCFNQKDNKLDMINYTISQAFSLEYSNSKNLKNNVDINKVYTKGNIKITNMILKKASNRILSIIKSPLSYKILTNNIICNYNNDPSGIIFVKDRFEELICDAFCDDYSEKVNRNIIQLFTKVNRKPSKKIIDITASNVIKLFEKMYEKIRDEFLNCNDREMFKLFSLYETVCNDYTFDKKLNYLLKNLSYSEQLITQTLNFIELISNQIISLFKKYFPELDNSRDVYVSRINNYMSEIFPPLEGDKVIQIGSCVQINGQKEPFLRHIITLNSCDPIEGTIVESYDTEEEVLLAWTDFIQNLDPDFITGYNIFGFDYSFMMHRAEELDIVDEFANFGRLLDVKSRLECKKLASSALGDNTLNYITMEGRVQMDLLKVIQRDHNLVSYKLDYVAENFMNDAIIEISDFKLKIKGAKNLSKGNFITINVGGDSYKMGKKFKIKDIQNDTLVLFEKIDKDILNKKPKWQLAKDDVSPKEIFEFQKQGPDKRKIVAVYCIQDCALCLNIIDKLNIVTNSMGMSNVCSVPLSFIFLRGQGIKIFSLISRECRKSNFLIPNIKSEKEEIRYKNNKIYNFEPAEDDDIKVENDGGYEGAIVLKPHPGIYLEEPIPVLDYASLYPSSMISENLSFDSIILEEDGKYLGDKGKELLNKMGYTVNDITHDVYKWIDPKIKSKGKIKTGIKTRRFVQPKDGSKGIVPTTLEFLLKARKDTRTRAKYKVVTTKSGESFEGLYSETDDKKSVILTKIDKTKHKIEKEDVESVNDKYTEDEKDVLDGYQLAFKMTANSTYGQIGAPTSSIYFKDIAASTTATGRSLLHLAKSKVEEKFNGAEIVYGDTDSIFINFNPKDSEGNRLKDKEALKKSIDLGVEAEEYIQTFLKPPHKLEYEKTFLPFVLLSKKRYIGNKYEFDLNKYKETSMGIVLKRRDNADIVKHVYGGILNIIMNEKNLEKSVKFCQNELKKLLKGEFGHDMLTITKSLRGYYKNPDQIAHKVLADRIGVREPGNKPQATDRIPYIYIENKNAILQGDKIETPSYILENKLKIDYKYYITNQIMNPVCQIYGLALEKLKGYKLAQNYFNKKYDYLLEINGGDIKKTQRKIDELKTKEVTKIVFGDILREAENKKIM